MASIGLSVIILMGLDGIQMQGPAEYEFCVSLVLQAGRFCLLP